MLLAAWTRCQDLNTPPSLAAAKEKGTGKGEREGERRNNDEERRKWSEGKRKKERKVKQGFASVN